MITPGEFKATVRDFIERQDGTALPRPGEFVLVGHAEGVGWKRGRIKPPYAWVPSWIVRGFILKWRIDRLAVVAPGDEPRQFRVAFAERAGGPSDHSITDRKLASLVDAARREWNRPAHAPLRTLFGRPWPIAALSAVLLLELGPGLIRLSRGVTLASPVVYFVEVALIVATVVMLWRQSRIGYALALALSAIQFLYPVVVDLPYVQSDGLGTVAVWLLLSWSYPAAIWLALGYLWLERARRRLL